MVIFASTNRAALTICLFLGGGSNWFAAHSTDSWNDRVGFISGAQITPDEKSIVTLHWHSPRLGIWSSTDGQLIKWLTIPEGFSAPMSLRIAPDGRHLAFCALTKAGYRAVIMDSESGNVASYGETASQLAWLSSRRFVTTSAGIEGPADPFLRWRTLDNRSIVNELGVGEEGSILDAVVGLSPERVVTAMAQQESLLRRPHERELAVVDLLHPKVVFRQPTRLHRCASIVASRKERLLVSGGGVTEIYDITSWQRLRRYPRSPITPILGATLSPNGKYVAFGNVGVEVRDVDSNQLRWAARAGEVSAVWPNFIHDPSFPLPHDQFSRHVATIRDAFAHLQFSSDSTRVLGVTFGGQVLEWATDTGEETRQVTLGKRSHTRSQREGYENRECLLQHLEALKSDDLSIRRLAAYKILRSGSGAKELLPSALSLLQDEDAYLRNVGWRLVVRFGLDGRGALTQIADGLSDDDPAVRQSAGYALAILASQNTANPEVFVMGLRDKDLLVQAMSAFAIEKSGSWTEDAVPELARIVRRERVFEGEEEMLARTASVHALHRMGKSAAPVIETLISALNSDVSDIRETACRTLKEIGPAALGALPVLRGLLRDKDAEVREAARSAVRSISRYGEPSGSQ